MLIEQPRKVAMPPEACSLMPPVQVRTPPAGLVPIARVTIVVLSPLTRLLLTSATATRGCWLQVVPAAPPPGWVRNTRWVAPEPTVKAVLVIDTPKAVDASSRYPDPTRLIAQPLNAALPAKFVLTVLPPVQLRTAPGVPVPAAIDSVMAAAGTGPPAKVRRTTGCGLSAEPAATALPGWVVNVSSVIAALVPAIGTSEAIRAMLTASTDRNRPLGEPCTGTIRRPPRRAVP